MPGSLSFTISQSLLTLMSTESVMERDKALRGQGHTRQISVLLKLLHTVAWGLCISRLAFQLFLSRWFTTNVV